MHAIRSDEGKTLETSAFFKLFTVANLRYQLIILDHPSLWIVHQSFSY